ncbi:MAG: ribosome biogenesis GTP-binding protein YihA/YsxC [Bacteroidales bacterium]|nr:ribosome biogenesis GTP-binding protein YihA/YsxC [Bacteroidales bacterium]MDD3859419.1 ribosome biogenesis GTP-binding protein YihA/YsxC [Bacteroidales bacterium]
MIIKTASYLMSVTDYTKCPDADRPEIAFIGRSNVGKSSLINMITNIKGLAKTSSTPGKTLKINHFIINDTWYLVDLPGYGYAKISKKMRESISSMIKSYILKRENLICLFVLIDCRIPAQKVDIEFMYWLGINSVPFSIVFTKSDKLNEQKLKTNLDNYLQVLAETWENIPQIFITSSESKKGRAVFLDYIENIVKQ